MLLVQQQGEGYKSSDAMPRTPVLQCDRRSMLPCRGNNVLRALVPHLSTQTAISKAASGHGSVVRIPRGLRKET
jgi:hypothetical protein